MSSGAGRPLDPTAEQRIIAAVLDTLDATQDVSAVTIRGIASAAGVGPGTIYRRWTSVDEVIADAIDSRRVPMVIDQDADLVTQVLQALSMPDGDWLTAEQLQLERMRRQLILSNARFREFVRQRHRSGRRSALLTIVRRGQADGALSAGLDAETMVTCILGVAMYLSLREEDPREIVRALLGSWNPASQTMGTP